MNSPRRTVWLHGLHSFRARSHSFNSIFEKKKREVINKTPEKYARALSCVVFFNVPTVQKSNRSARYVHNFVLYYALAYDFYMTISSRYLLERESNVFINCLFKREIKRS